ISGCQSFVLSGANNRDFTCVLGGLTNSNGATPTRTITINGTAAITKGVQDTLNISAAVAPNNANDYFDTNTGNDAAATSSQIVPNCDLAPSLTTVPATVLNGASTSYVVTVANNGGPRGNLAAAAAKVTGAFTGAHAGTTLTITGITGCATPTFSGGNYTCVL